MHRLPTDSITDSWEKELELNEVVVVAKRPVVKQQEGKLVYLVKNDPYAKGLDGESVLDRVPRVSVNNGAVSVAGKGTVRYIIDGILMELDASAMSMRLKSLQAEDIEKIELLTTPPPDMQRNQMLYIYQSSLAMKLSAPKATCMAR